ncbi:MAG: hypothetical protein QOJ65_2309 [Fimbriimonadaceae bacterium]|jgi:tetratricopeptide (TPR) repeat protein|nr:hypothetical protein [Fimbriimonadaceae bacterium]
MKPIALPLALLLLTASAHAQTLEDSLAQVNSGNLKAARKSLQALTAAEPKSATAWHMLGVVELALSDATAAEKAFTGEIEAGPGKTTPTGLNGTALTRGLRLLKAAIALDAGEAEAYNNRGAARMLLGRTDDATADTDRAATLRSDWGMPWVNGAQLALEADKPELAEKDLRLAMNLGEKTPLAFALLAESQFKLGRIERADDALKDAFDRDPSHPYALMLKAQMDTSRGRLREAERALAQALSAGPQVAVDSKLVRRAGEGSGLAGNPREGHLNLLDRSFHGLGSATRFQAYFNRQIVEGRSNGSQQSGVFELTHSSGLGALHGLHVNASGGRPGAESTVVNLSPSPNARHRFTQTQAMWLKPFTFGGNGTLWLHSSYRTADLHVKTSSTDPMQETLKDSEWLGEFRYDVNLTATSLLQIGGTHATLRRSGAGPRPIQPNEQVLGNGTTRVWTAYAINRRPLFGPVDLTWGAMAGGAAGSRQFQPLIDLGLRRGNGGAIHLRVTPRFNDSVSNLIPLDAVAENPQDNPIDRNLFTTTNFNRNPTLEGAKSKMIDIELQITGDQTVNTRTETILFHRKLNDVNSQGADPRLATTLILTPVREGEASGIEQRYTRSLTDALTLRLLGRLQETRADFVNPTYDVDKYPTLVPKTGDMPNFPKFQAIASLDYARGPWNASLVGVYFGERTAAVTRLVNNAPSTFLRKAKAGANAHVLIQRKMSRQSTATLNIFNIGRANFYPGYPGDTTFVLGMDYRY